MTTTGSALMRASSEPRMRASRLKPSSCGISRSVNTMTSDGSVSIARHAASPSTSSRTPNERLRIEAKVVRTNLESSTTSTRFCGKSVDDAIQGLTLRGPPRRGA
jgi:hypothetical protein